MLIDQLIDEDTENDDLFTNEFHVKVGIISRRIKSDAFG